MQTAAFPFFLKAAKAAASEPIRAGVIGVGDRSSQLIDQIA